MCLRLSLQDYKITMSGLGEIGDTALKSVEDLSSAIDSRKRYLAG